MTHPWMPAGGALLDALLTVIALPPLAATTYLAVLAARARAARTDPGLVTSSSVTQFDVVIPAHDEEVGITRTVESLAGLDYPPELFRIVVVADNCSDRTADLARDAGATVLERIDVSKRGKGHALDFAFDACLREGRSDAVVVVDADTSVSPELLRAFDAAIQGGSEAMQAHYGVRDAGHSWRTRLAHLGLILFHGVRSSAREAFGVSCGLRGNGMCFRTDLLRRVPHKAFSIVEDLEYGIVLGRAGVRVQYVEGAWVRGDMPTTSDAARSQRARWEGGRQALRRAQGWPLLFQALRQGDGMLLDLSLDLLVPPLSRLAVMVALGIASCAGLALLMGSLPVSLVLWGAAMAGLCFYVARGCAMTVDPLRSLLDLLWAPFFVVWKLTVRSARAGQRGEWVRTTRTAIPGNDS